MVDERETMAQREDLTGRVFGRLSVLRFESITPGRDSQWLCYCNPEYDGCGKTKVVSRSQLTRTKKPTRSCGCLHIERVSVAPDFKPTKAALYEQYVVKGKSTCELAEWWEVTHSAVCDWLEEAGIPRRVKSEAMKKAFEKGRAKSSFSIPDVYNKGMETKRSNGTFHNGQERAVQESARLAVKRGWATFICDNPTCGNAFRRQRGKNRCKGLHSVFCCRRCFVEGQSVCIQRRIERLSAQAVELTLEQQESVRRILGKV